MSKILALIISLALPLCAMAEDLYVARGNVNLRSDYPKFPFYRNAPSKGVIQKGEPVFLLERKEVFSDQWIRVKVLNTGLVGWAYNGESGQTPYFTKQEAQ